MQKKLRNWKTELSWIKSRVFPLWEQLFLRYITWNLVVFSRLINIYKVTDWMIFIEWPWMNETFNRQARKVESWMSQKDPNRNSASPMLNKIVVLRNCAKPVPEPLFIGAACPLLATLLKKKLRHRYFPVVTFHPFNLVGVLMLECFSWPLSIRTCKRKPFRQDKW